MSTSSKFYNFHGVCEKINRASMRENLSSENCEQHRRRPSCASAQSDQRLVICVLENTISQLATCEISVVHLVSVAEETGFSLALSETPKTGFVATRPNIFLAHLAIS